ncbi:PP2C family protein-serine/threonine phosphatase [Streptomyces sp. NK08204]|uniref:PP2C family protein-serine/threonine phosphatase n=1 Tax=Streptomyces sp. NK08204 TaxID=2873260 RepID=UPI001CEDC0B4|nr:PP2C family protein-serine/threonine phosphatase [Streptomyces sp. NK08204]
MKGLVGAPDDEVLRRSLLPRVWGRGVGWAPLLLLVGVILLDFFTSAPYRFISWAVLVPGTAAALCGMWTTATYAVLAMATYLVMDTVSPDRYRAGLPDFILVGLGGVLATLACVVRLRGERRMLRMRDIVETTRRTVLRPMPPVWAGLEHAAVYLAADTDARVGGDFYDIQPGPHGTRVLIGDVQGKGLGAVETAAALLGTFREAGYHEADLATVAQRLEARMVRHRIQNTALGRDDGDRFATAVLIGFPGAGPVNGDGAGEACVEVVNFGHEPPLAVGPYGVRVLPAGDGLPLGLGELADGPPPVRRVPLADEETLLLVTDGVTEARNGPGEFYPLAREVARLIGDDPRRAEPLPLVRLVRDGVLRHCEGRLEDDTTVFALRRAVAEEDGRERLQS